MAQAPLSRAPIAAGGDPPGQSWPGGSSSTNDQQLTRYSLAMTKPRIPEVGEYVRSFGTLIDVQDVTPPQAKVTDYIFEDTTATWELRINGRKIQDYSTTCNGGEKDSCVAHAINCAKSLAKSLGKTDAEIVVVKITTRVRMRPNGREHFYAKEFQEFQPLHYGRHEGLPEEKREDVWSSKRGKLTG